MTFKLPPEITIKQEQQNGKRFYVFRHEKFGELGRVILSNYMGHTHFATEVSGELDDPLTQTRREILEPIANAIMEEIDRQTGNREVKVPPPPANYSHGIQPSSHTFEAQFLSCLNCGTNVAHIIYSRATRLCEIEDCYRIFYTKLHEVNLTTWIVGDQQSDGKVLVLKSWPERSDYPKWVSGEQFNTQILNLQNFHCSKKKEVFYN